MYHFSYFKEQNEATLLQFLHDHPFAFLAGSFANGEPVATQIPMLVEVRDGMMYLQGHIMRNTDHHKAFLENQQVLAVFTGPNAYVSASWYSNPRIGSTWNYMSVYAGGSLRFFSEEELIAFMRKFTLRFEGNNQGSPVIYDNLAKEYVDAMVKGIVGIEKKSR